MNDGARPVRPGYWFKPKRFGWGVTPVTWQGWAVTVAGAAALILTIHHLRPLAVRIAVGLAIVSILFTITAAKTDGGWRWRWGGDE